ncbi:VP3 protein [Corriparta virus]|uniref:Outer capsid protein VP2 n=1 Tax=Corriparta virus TaxID=40053 RepID=T1SQN8_9REOV|nr:VP3 protein [Corriparta virus]AGT51056.1 VP3 protein [Corriparta virus]
MAEYNIAVLERTIDFDDLAKCLLRQADLIIITKSRWPEDVNSLTQIRSVKVSLLNLNQDEQGLMVHHTKEKKAEDVYLTEPVVQTKNVVQRLYYSLADQSINIRMTDRTDGYDTAKKLASDFMNSKVIVKNGEFDHRLRIDTQIGKMLMHQSLFTPMHLARHTVCVNKSLHPLDVARKWYDQVTHGWMKMRIPNVKVGTQEYAHGKLPSDPQLGAGTMALADYSYSKNNKRMVAMWNMFKEKELLKTAWRASTVYGPEVQMLGVTTMYTVKDLHEDDKAIADVNAFSLVWGTMATQAPYYKRLSKHLTHDISCRVRVLLRVNDMRAIELYYILMSRILPPWFRKATGVSEVDIVEGKESFQLSDIFYEDMHPLEVLRSRLNRDVVILPPFYLPRKTDNLDHWMTENFPYLKKLRQITHLTTYKEVPTTTLMEVTTLNNLLLLIITLIPGANIDKENTLDVAVFEIRSSTDTVNRLAAHEKHHWEYVSPAIEKNFLRKITVSMAVSRFSSAFSSYMGLTLHQVADLQRVGLPDEEYHDSVDKYEEKGDDRDKAWRDEKTEIDAMKEGPAKEHALKQYKLEKSLADHRFFFVKTAKRVRETVDRAWNFAIKSLDYVTYNQVSGVMAYHCWGFADVMTSSIPLRAPRRSHIPLLIGPGYLKQHDIPHLLSHRFPLTYDTTTGSIGILIDHGDRVVIWKRGDVRAKVRDLVVGKIKGKLITISVEGGVVGSDFYGVKLGSVS